MSASRREQLLSTAADLFAERGFHGTSVADLGAACGMSGPALYKHFPSKDALLAAMLVSISEELLAVGTERSAAAPDATDALHALVDWHITFALANKSLIVVQDRDWASLPAEAREKVRALQRSYVELWAARLRERATRSSPTSRRDRPRARGVRAAQLHPAQRVPARGRDARGAARHGRPSPGTGPLHEHPLVRGVVRRRAHGVRHPLRPARPAWAGHRR